MIGLLKEWGTLAIATIALVQPWLLGLWKTFVRKGMIDIHETGTIEVGYSGFGPTIALYGTLRAINRDQFVQNIELHVIKLKDSSRHKFEWGLFRSEKFTVGGKQETSLELPTGFMLTTAQPYRYNILFSDSLVQSEIRPLINELTNSWTKTLFDEGGRSATEQGVNPIGGLVQSQQVLKALYDKFSKQDVHIKAFTALDRLCYWEPGKYSLEMCVNTFRPSGSFVKQWSFELSREDSERLRLNAIIVILEICGRPFGQYNFANVKFN